VNPCFRILSCYRSTSGSPAAVLLLHQRMVSRDGHFQGVGLTIAYLAPGNMCATGGGTYSYLGVIFPEVYRR